MNRLLSSAGLIAVLMASPPPAYGNATDSGYVEEVLVVGARDVRPIQDVAASVDVLTHEDLDRTMAVTLADAVRYLPGVSAVSADNRFGTTELSIRGMSGNRVVSLIDGIPVADQFDVGAFSNAGQDWLVADSVSRIEVLRGPASTLFGSDALGGVVAIVSREPHEYLENGRSAVHMGVTHNSADASTNLSTALAGGGERLSGLLHLAASDGNERDASAASGQDNLSRERLAARGVIQANLAPGQQLRFHYSIFDEEVSSNLESVLGYGRRYRNTVELLGDDERERRSLALAYDFEVDFEWLTSGAVQIFEQRTGVVQWTHERRSLATGDVALHRKFDFDVAARGLTLDLRSSFSHGSVQHELGWGVHAQRAELEEYRSGQFVDLETGATSNVLLGETLPVRDFPRSIVGEVGLYVHDEISIGDFTLIPALRYERHKLSASDDQLFAGAVDDALSRWVPKFGLIWRANERWSFFSQYAAGFKAPPFEDVNIGLDIPLFNYRAVPNPDLKPETSHGLDVGVRYSGTQTRFSATAFLTRYSDFIASRVNIGRDPVTSTTLFQSLNLNEAEVYGFEADLEQDLDRLLEGLRWTARVSWVRGEDRDTGEPLINVDPLEFVTSLQWQINDRVHLSLHGTVVDGQRCIDLPRGDAFISPGFGVWDLTMGYAPDAKTRINLGVFNLADKTYWRWSSVRGRDVADPLIAVMSQPGRHVSVSIQRRVGG